MSITVYGASDDLVAVEGDIHQEFSPNYSEGSDPSYLGFSDGTLLSITYTQEGIWRIQLLRKGAATVTITPCPPSDDDTEYSDRAELSPPPPPPVAGVTFDATGPAATWVVFGTGRYAVAHAKGVA